MVKKIISLIIFILSLSVSGCSVFQKLLSLAKPELRFDRIEFKGINEENLELKAVVFLENPYPVSIPSGRLDAKVEINNIELTRWKLPVAKIEANSTKPLELDFSIPYTRLSTIFHSINRLEVIPLRLSGSATLDLSRISAELKDSNIARLQFKKEMDVPAIYPEVNVENFSVRLSGEEGLSSLSELLITGLGDRDIEITYDLIISNKADASFSTKNLNYGFKLNGQRLIIGEALSAENFGKTSILRVKTSLPIQGFSRNFLRFLTSRHADYEVSGAVNFEFPEYDGIPPISFDFKKEDSVRW